MMQSKECKLYLKCFCSHLLLRQAGLISIQQLDQRSNYLDNALGWILSARHFVSTFGGGRNLYCLNVKTGTSMGQRCLRHDRREKMRNAHLMGFAMLMVFFTGLFHATAYAQGNTIKVAVAANLILPMQEIKRLYEEKYKHELILIPGSSGKLTAQIIHGAPYDIFLSADMKYPQQLYKEGHAAGKPEVLLRGRLVFWSKKKPAESLEQWLVNADIQSLAIAQPELAPYGQRAKDWLSEKGIYEVMLPEIIFAESIGQVNQYIRSGAVEAAFTAISAMYAEELKGTGYWLPLTVHNGNSHRLDHGLVVMKNAVADQDILHQFMTFIKSPVAVRLFRDFGYEIID